MSALAQSRPYPVASFARLTENEATLEVSRFASHHSDAVEALDAIARTALRVKGVRRVELEDGSPAAQLLHVPFSWSRSSTNPHGLLGSAVADVVSNDVKWGRLRLHFDLNTEHLESPLRFARFLAQQFAAVLTRAEQIAKGNRLRATAIRLRKIVERRKAIRRSVALVAKARGVSEREALTFLVRHSREAHKSLHQVADAFIFSNADKWRVRPLRRAVR